MEETFLLSTPAALSMLLGVGYGFRYSEAQQALSPPSPRSKRSPRLRDSFRLPNPHPCRGSDKDDRDPSEEEAPDLPLDGEYVLDKAIQAFLLACVFEVLSRADLEFLAWIVFTPTALAVALSLTTYLCEVAAA